MGILPKTSTVDVFTTPNIQDVVYSIRCPNNWDLYEPDDTCYAYSPVVMSHSLKELTYGGAVRQCSRLGAVLAEPRTPQLNNFLDLYSCSGCYGAPGGAWIGIYLSGSDVVVWRSDGTDANSTNYSNWKDGQPAQRFCSSSGCSSNLCGSADYGYGGWTMLVCSKTLPYFCARPASGTPAPTTTAT